MPAIRDPIQEQRFDQLFSTEGKSGAECLDMSEALFVALRRQAAAVAAEWLRERSHFNGELENHLYFDADAKQCKVQVVLQDFGLPYAEGDDNEHDA